MRGRPTLAWMTRSLSPRISTSRTDALRSELKENIKTNHEQHPLFECEPPLFVGGWFVAVFNAVLPEICEDSTDILLFHRDLKVHHRLQHLPTQQDACKGGRSLGASKRRDSDAWHRARRKVCIG